MAGLKPLYPCRVRKVYVPSSDGSALGIGDAVIKTGDSNDAEIRSGSGVYAVGELPEVIRATSGDGNLITGVVLSVDPDPDNRFGANYRAASTQRVLTIADLAADPNCLFEIEADGAMTVDDIGLNTNLVGTASVNTASGEANVKADADAAADASNQLLIVAMVPRVGNDITSSNPKLIVKINKCTETTGAGAADGALGIA